MGYCSELNVCLSGFVEGSKDYWVMCTEMMKCLKDAVPDYAEKVISLVLNRSVTKQNRACRHLSCPGHLG